MNAIITYKEISDFLEKTFSICPNIRQIDERTCEARYKHSSITPAVAVKFHIDDIYEDTICLSYDCGTASKLMIGGLLTLFKEKIPNGIAVNAARRCINIDLQQFEQMEKVLNVVALSDISLGYNSVNVSLEMV